MKRRHALALGAFGALAPRLAAGTNAPPDRIRLVPDRWHIGHVGRLPDGRLWWIAGQLHSDGRVTHDFACTFLFDADGSLVEYLIEGIGVRGQGRTSGSPALDRHVARLAGTRRKSIWVRPFAVEQDGITFGLIPRLIDDGSWRVEFMPGNTLSFYPPWETGGYDT